MVQKIKHKHLPSDLNYLESIKSNLIVVVNLCIFLNALEVC